jgi:hypothetical protein
VEEYVSGLLTGRCAEISMATENNFPNYCLLSSPVSNFRVICSALRGRAFDQCSIRAKPVQLEQYIFFKN